MKNKKFKQRIALLLSLALSMPTTMVYAQKTVLLSDIAGHWAESSILQMIEEGVLSGYDDGTFKPEGTMTRAELASYIQRIFALEVPEETLLYEDVAATSWYKQAVDSVMALGIMNDYGTTFNPNQPATREEAIYAIVQAYSLQKGEVDKMFLDQSQVADWAEEAVAILASTGGLKGHPDGSLQPKGYVTRAEIVSLVTRMTGDILGEAGTYEGINLAGNMVINTPDVVLKDSVIEGDLYLAQGIGTGEVTLENVQVKGTVRVEGGGANSVYMNSCTIEKMIVSKEGVRLVGDEVTKIENMLIEVAAEIEGELLIAEATISAADVVIETMPEKLTFTDEKIQATVGGESVTQGTIDAANKPSAGGSGNNSGGPTTDDDDDDEIPEEEWNLVWSDEFDGTEVDESKWAFQIGTQAEGGPANWGNQELQYYTKENSRIEDGKLVISAQREEKGGMEYTSSRLWTEPTYLQKYGRVEAKISLPEGQGLWPAFWMLPKNSPYGGWAAGGEIDIMEARGREPHKVDGTIHFGEAWPNNIYQGGHYTFPEGEDFTTEHVYAIEWEPGEIRWYVDDNLYHIENNWYSKDGIDPVEYTYPAPFDQEFYILLNLAVGGTYDGNIAPDESVEMPAEMTVDYVRVYESAEGYDEEVEKPVLNKDDYPEGAREPINGNFVLDPNVQDVVQSPTELDKEKWNCAVTEGGVASTSSVEGGAKVTITNGGGQPYSVQMIDHFPLATGRIYELSFDAKADAPRSMTAQFGSGSERGWEKYSSAFSARLDDEWKTYTYRFQMAGDTHDTARVEFNMGQNTNAVYMKNVVVKEIDKLYEEDAAKEPLVNGNNVYNSTFDKGEKSAVFWNFTNNDEVTGVVNKGKQAEIQVNTDESVVVLKQKGMNMVENDEYVFAFDGAANTAAEVEASLTSKDGSTTYMSEKFILDPGMDTYEGTFTVPAGKTDAEGILSFKVAGSDQTITLDNVWLERTTNNNLNPDDLQLYPLKNGDFSLDFNYWEPLAVEGGGAIFTVEGEDKVAVVDVTVPGSNPWNVMLNNNGLSFTKGLTYNISFDAWADVDRDIQVILEGPGYSRLFDQIEMVGKEKQTFEYAFEMTTEDILHLKFFFGNTENQAVGKVYLDNVKIEAQNAPVKQPGTLAADLEGNQVGKEITLKHTGDQVWVDAITGVEVNGEVTADYEATADAIKIAGSVFKEAGTYTIKVTADGYAASKVSQTIIPGDGNLITNGDFSAKDEGWMFWTAQPDHSEVTYENEEAVIQINYNGGVTTEWGDPVAIAWNTQFKQDGIRVVGGETYTLTFDAKSTIERPIKVELKGIGLPGDGVLVGVTTDMDTYEVTFTPPETIESFTVNMLMGNVIGDGMTTTDEPHAITIDNVRLVQEETTPEVPETLVVNGDFVNGIEGWGFWNYGDCSVGTSQVTAENGEAKVEIIDKGPETWSTQFFQENIALSGGKAYKLSMDIRSDVERQIVLEAMSATPNQMNETVTVGIETQTFEMVLKPTADMAAKINFLLGNVGDTTTDAHNIYIDNVGIEEVEVEPELEQVGIPAFSLPSGRYTTSQSLTITTDAGITVYYTTDGSMPTEDSTVYNGEELIIAETTTIRAFARKAGMADSDVVTARYIIGDDMGDAIRIGSTPVKIELEELPMISPNATQTATALKLGQNQQGLFYGETKAMFEEIGTYKVMARYKCDPAGVSIQLSDAGEMLVEIPEGPSKEYRESGWKTFNVTDTSEFTLRIGAAIGGDSPTGEVDYIVIEKVN